MFNVVCNVTGRAEAALVRGVEGHNGPGRLTKALNIDRSLNGVDLASSDKLWLEDDGVVPEYTAAPRIGIDYASDEDKNKKWRFTAI
jgi:DNA-3-methyladenine glycosylase